VTVRNGGSSKWDKKKQTCTYNKSLSRDWTKGVGEHTRDLIVSRTHALLLRRGECGMLEGTAESDELMDMIISMSMHEYSLVRKRAQKTLPRVLRRFPFAGDRVIERALAAIGSPSSSKGAVNGAVYTLNNSWGLRKVARQWPLFKQFAVAMIDARVVEDTKAQVVSRPACLLHVGSSA
jgi:hypothetical protein